MTNQRNPYSGYPNQFNFNAKYLFDQELLDITTNILTSETAEDLELNTTDSGKGIILTSATGACEIEGVLSVTDTTASTTHTDGALIVSGGCGISGDLYVNGDIHGTVLFHEPATDTLTTVTNFDGILSATDVNTQLALETIDDFGKVGTFSTSVDTPIIYTPSIISKTTEDITMKTTDSGQGLIISSSTGDTEIEGVLSISDTTESSSTSTGSIQTLGGCAVAKNIYCGGVIHGTLNDAFAFPSTFTLVEPGAAKLSAAVSAASSGDTLLLMGSYSESSTLTIDKSLNIVSLNNDPSSAIIDMNAEFFRINNSSITVNLNGFTLQDSTLNIQSADNVNITGCIFSFSANDSTILSLLYSQTALAYNLYVKNCEFTNLYSDSNNNYSPIKIISNSGNFYGEFRNNLVRTEIITNTASSSTTKYTLYCSLNSGAVLNVAENNFTIINTSSREPLTQRLIQCIGDGEFNIINNSFQSAKTSAAVYCYYQGATNSILNSQNNYFNIDTSLSPSSIVYAYAGGSVSAECNLFCDSIDQEIADVTNTLSTGVDYRIQLLCRDGKIYLENSDEPYKINTGASALELNDAGEVFTPNLTASSDLTGLLQVYYDTSTGQLSYDNT